MNKARVGIYGSVAKNTEENKIITKILGYDPFENKTVLQDEVIAPYSGRAHKFGVHFTLYDLFTPTNYDEMRAEIQKIADDVREFDFVFSGFSGYVRGDYQGRSIYNEKEKTVLGLNFDEKSIEKIRHIHEEVLVKIQKFRMAIEPEFDKEIFQKVPKLWSNIQNYGAPYVMDYYNPHLTLASGLDGSESTVNKLTAYLNETYGKDLLNHKIIFDKIYIFEEILQGEFKEHFQVIDEIKILKR